MTIAADTLGQIGADLSRWFSRETTEDGRRVILDPAFAATLLGEFAALLPPEDIGKLLRPFFDGLAEAQVHLDTGAVQALIQNLPSQARQKAAAQWLQQSCQPTTAPPWLADGENWEWLWLWLRWFLGAFDHFKDLATIDESHILWQLGQWLAALPTKLVP